MFRNPLISFLFISLFTHLVFGQVNPFESDFSGPSDIPGMKLVWSDEFNYEGSPDSMNWVYENGFVRNKELQWYQSDNANCSGGVLIVSGRREKVKNPNYDPTSSDWRKKREYADYTSSSIKTRDKHQWMFGRFIVRARINKSKGSWPAIWMLGVTKPWPSCGETDIMEFYRVSDTPSILANFAWGTEKPGVPKWDSKVLKLEHFTKVDPDWVNKYHIWQFDWNRDSMKISLDGERINDISLNETINADGSNPFLQEHYLLLNLAIGANGGDPSQTPFPIAYEVDYARVYQESNPIMQYNQLKRASIHINVPYYKKLYISGNIIDLPILNQAEIRSLHITMFTPNGRKVFANTVRYSHSTISLQVNIGSIITKGIYILRLTVAIDE